MNYLAHLFLAGTSTESLIGNLAGDFVKGRARYALEDRSIAYTYSRNLFTLAPGFDARIGFLKGLCYLSYDSLGLEPTEVAQVYDYQASELSAAGRELS